MSFFVRITWLALLLFACIPAWAQRLNIDSDTNLPDGRVGVLYFADLSASGGSPPYRWELQNGQLPEGMTLIRISGSITGVPTTAGDYDFMVRVIDQNDRSDQKRFRLTIRPLLANAPSITTSSLANGTVGASYTASLAANGGRQPYTWSISEGSLPAGVELNAGSGALTGTPTTPGAFDFTAVVTDADNQTASRTLRITIVSAPITVTTSTLPGGSVGQAYSQALSGAGGTPPYSWSLSAGALPAGLSISNTGTISGTPSAAGSSDFTVRVADSAGQSATRALRITIAGPPPSVTTTSLSAGTVGQTYSASLAATGGTAPYTWAVASGALPGGLTLAPSGAISGTPTAAGNFDFTVRVTDAASQSATQALRIVINAAPTPPSITTASLSAGTVNSAYSATLAATGGTAPYSWAVASGSLPAGLTLAGSGAISGTPTTAGNADFTVRVTDAASQTATRALRITINPAPTPPSITTSSFSAGTVNQAYSATLAATGGTAPYAWAVASGSLPAGLTLAGNGAISGTPTTAGNFDFTVRVSDSANQSATRALRITINAAPTPPTITTSSLSAGRVGQAYTGSLAANGGTAPYSWAVSSGNLPPGLALAAGGGISGTPTTAGDFDFTVRVTDAASQSATRALRLTIAAAVPALSISTNALPGGTVGVEYSQALAATGGRAPYTWAVASGALPSGLSLEPAGRIAGTPTAAGAFPVTLRVTDADSRTAERALSITVIAAVTISACPTAGGVVGVEYAATLAAVGGQSPYAWSVTSGQLPPGVTLTEATGVLRGTPSLAGAFTFTVNVSDTANRSATRACTVTIRGPLQILTESLPDATTRAPYTQPVRATGGTQPYRWTTIAGALPPGVVLDEAVGAITGQPTQPGQFAFTVQVTDAAGAQMQRPLTLNVVTGVTIPACPTPITMVNQTYNSPLSAVGGQSPYTWALENGSLPAGLQLGTSTGVVSGTPTAAGNSEFTLRVGDATGALATRPCSIRVAPELAITTSALTAGEAGVAYTFALQASGGSAPYTWAITAGALAPGLTLNSATGQIAGTPSTSGTFRLTVRVTDAAGLTQEKAFELTIGAGFSITACPTPATVAGEPYSSSLSLAGGEAPIAWAIAAGALPAGLTLSTEGALTGAATTAGTSEFTIRGTDARSRTATRACSIVVTAAALRVTTSETLPTGVLGRPYTQSLQAAGGTAPYVWSVVNGIVPAGLTLAASGELSGTASNSGTYQFTVRVADAANGTATRVFTLRVIPAELPTVSFLDVPDIVPPAQQPRIRVALDRGYPVALRGRLTLRFTPDPGLNVDDPSVRFVTGERAVDFEIAADTTEAVFPVPELALQTGSVAGAIDLAVTLAASDLDVTPNPAPAKTIRIDRTAPVISNVRVNAVSGGFELIITGFSTTREVSMATFQFTTATGSRLDNAQVTVQTDAAARRWFGDAASNGFGGQFTFVQPFTLQNAALSEVVVTLTNAQGTSQPARARF